MKFQQVRSTFASTGNQIEHAYSFDKKAKNRMHFVNWSGGTDSTLCLYELLKYYGPEHVTAITYKFPWLDKTKFKHENECRENFKKKMDHDGLGGFRHTTFVCEQQGYLLNGVQGGNPQSTSWLLTIPLYMYNGDYFYDTSIREDDILLKNESIHKTIKHVSKLLDRKIIFRQPYAYYHKYQILQKLFEYDIYHYTWYCELPCPDNCFNCQPCRLHMSSLDYLSFYAADDIAKKAQDEIERLKVLHEQMNTKEQEPMTAIERYARK